MTNTKKQAGIASVSFVILCVCLMVPNYAQYQVSPLGPQVIAEYGMELAQLSSLFSAPMIPAIFFSLIGGILIALFFIMAANVAIGSFLPTALGARGVAATTAGTMAAFYTIGNLLGCFAAPAAIGILKSQKKVLFLFAVLAAIGIAGAWMIPNTILLAVALLLTGTFLGGMIPTLMGLPVQFETVGPVYAGTAGGIIGTVQLFGAVVLPSYVLAPIAGGNFVILYILAGACVLISGVLSLCIREI